MALSPMTPDELRRVRKAAGWSQGELASELGVSTRAVQEWEGERRALPPMLHLALAALALYPDPERLSPGLLVQMQAARVKAAEQGFVVLYSLAGALLEVRVAKGGHVLPVPATEALAMLQPGDGDRLDRAVVRAMEDHRRLWPEGECPAQPEPAPAQVAAGGAALPLGPPSRAPGSMLKGRK